MSGKVVMGFALTALTAVLAVALLSRTAMGSQILGIVPLPKAK